MGNDRPRAYVIGTVQLKGFGTSDRYAREVGKCWTAAGGDDPESDLTLESYAITVGNVYKVIDIWSGPSNEAIMQFWENPGWNSCPYDEIMTGEVLEYATQIFSSKK